MRDIVFLGKEKRYLWGMMRLEIIIRDGKREKRMLLHETNIIEKGNNKYKKSIAISSRAWFDKSA